MFKIVDHDDLRLFRDDLSISMVDIQLVDEAIVSDPVFVEEKSILHRSDSQRYVHTPLHSIVSEKELTKIQDFIYSVLSALGGGINYLCFFNGSALSEDDLEEIKNSQSMYYDIDAFCDDLFISGRVIIAELTIKDMWHYRNCFGKYDSMRGIAVESRNIPYVLENLSLSDPVPTTENHTAFQNNGDRAIKTGLRYGKFFFEEVGNGTRFRVVSQSINRNDIVKEIDHCISVAFSHSLSFRHE